MYIFLPGGYRPPDPPPWKLDLIDSVLKLLLYGPRFRIMEILEIEVCSILYNPGNIGKRIFSIQSYPGNSGSYDPYSVLSWKYWIVRSIFNPILEIMDRTTHIQSHPGNSGSYDPYISPILEIMDRTMHNQSYPGNNGLYDPYSILSWK